MTDTTATTANDDALPPGPAAGVRSFVAVPLPPALQADVLATAQALAAALPEVKWSRKVENLHVTMKFLGPVPPPRLQVLAAALGDELGTRASFEITLRGLGAFPDQQHTNTIWAGVEDVEGRLEAVAMSVERVMARMGLGGADRRGFRPHVTIGRCKQGVDARRALEPWRAHRFGTAEVAALHVYESRLSPGGSTYVLRGRAPLGGARAERVASGAMGD